MQMPSPDKTILKIRPQIIAQLRAALPAECVIDDERETKAYECDALSAYRCPRAGHGAILGGVRRAGPFASER